MWRLVLLFVFVLVLSMVLRHTRCKKTRRQETIIAVLPIVIEQGLPVAILPDDTHAQISFEGQGLLSDRLAHSGVQMIEVQSGINIKAPVRLARRSRPKISALSLGPNVKAVTVDLGTKQMTLHRAELSSSPQFRYEVDHTGTQTGVRLKPLGNEMWSRVGSVSLDLDADESSGTHGIVQCDRTKLRVDHAVPGKDTVLGRKDLVEGKYRMVFNLQTKTAFVQ